MSAAASPSFLPRVWSNWRRFTLKPLLVLSVLCLVARDEYPLSNFPMYSRFAPKTDYYFLADSTGRPLPLQTLTGMRTPALKKIYQSEVSRLRVGPGKVTGFENKRAGERTLERLRGLVARKQGSAGASAGLRLYRVEIRIAGSGFEKSTMLVAESR